MTESELANSSLKRLLVENTTEHEITLVLEPWATEHRMLPGERFIIESRAPADVASEDSELWRVPQEGGSDDMVVWACLRCQARIVREDGTIVADW